MMQGDCIEATGTTELVTPDYMNRGQRDKVWTRQRTRELIATLIETNTPFPGHGHFLIKKYGQKHSWDS